MCTPDFSSLIFIGQFPIPSPQLSAARSPLMRMRCLDLVSNVVTLHEVNCITIIAKQFYPNFFVFICFTRSGGMRGTGCVWSDAIEETD